MNIKPFPTLMREDESILITKENAQTVNNHCSAMYATILLYEILLNPQSLSKMLRLRRGIKGIRTCAEIIGISPATLSRMERGHSADTTTLKLVFDWLNTSTTPEESREGE